MEEMQVKNIPKFIPKLPSVIISDILVRLGSKDVARYKSVSKEWNAITMHPHFVTARQLRAPHLILQSEDACRYVMVQDMDLLNLGKRPMIVNEVSIHGHEPRSLKILGSCNGLLCIIHRKDINPIFIYNPITGEAFELPNLPIKSFNTFGFGFDQLHNKYKVFFDVYTQKVNGAHIITLGESSWRTLDSPPELNYPWFKFFQTAVFFNGSLHWLAGNKIILSLDICSEKFKTLKIPDRIRCSYMYKMMNLGEYLALVPHDYFHIKFMIWYLHGSDFFGQSFGDFFANNQSRYIQLFGKLSDSSYVFQRTDCDDREVNDHYMTLYVPEKETECIERIYNIPFHRYEAIPFTPSLVSPRDLII